MGMEREKTVPVQLSTVVAKYPALSLVFRNTLIQWLRTDDNVVSITTALYLVNW